MTLRKLVTLGQLALAGASWTSCGATPSARTADSSTIDIGQADASSGDAGASDVVRREAAAPAIPPTCATDSEDLSDAFYGVFWERKQDELFDVTARVGATSEVGAPVARTVAGAPYEGARQLCYDFDWPGGLFIYYPDGAEPTRDLSAFDGGYLDLAVKSDADLFVGVSWRPPGATEDSRAAVRASRYFRGPAVDGWQEVSIPLCALRADLDHIKTPVSVSVPTVLGPEPVRVCVDAVRYRKALACPETCMPSDAGPVDGGTAPDASDADADAVDGARDRPTFDAGPDPVPPECRSPTTDVSRALYGVFWDQRQDELLGVTAEIGAQQRDGQPRPFMSAAPAYEGATQLCYELDSPGGVFVYYPDGSAAPTHDLSEFADGYLDLALRTDAPTTFIGLASVEGAWEKSVAVPSASYVKWVTPDGWKEISIPLCALPANLTQVKVPVAVNVTTVPGPAPVRLCVDAIRYRKGLMCPADCRAARDAGQSGDASPEAGAAADAASDAGTGPSVCPFPLVPPGCAGDAAAGDVFGLLLECKQDLPLDQPGGGVVGIDYQPGATAMILPQPTVPPYEGSGAICTRLSQGWAASFIYIRTAADGRNTVDLSAYSGGYLEAAIAADVGVQVGMSWHRPGTTVESRYSVSASSYVVGTNASGWREIRVPLCHIGANLAALTAPVTFTVSGVQSETTFCWDAVRLRKPLGSCGACPAP